MLKKAIQDAVGAALLELGLEAAHVVLERPGELIHGDFATNAALAASKKLKRNPRELAELIVSKLPKIDGVENVKIAGAGFINFYLTRSHYRELLASIHELGENWGKNDALAGRRIMYEYTDPNPFKVFHIGHLMSNAIGESLSRLAEAQGAKVVRANYQGDIGPHVAKCIWGLKKEGLSPSSIENMGKAYVIANNAYEDDPKSKDEIDAINKTLYLKSDPELNELYEQGRKTSLAHFEDIYKLLGTKFDHYFFESVVGPIGMGVVREGLKKGIFEESDGAIVYKGEKVGLHTRVFITRAGTPTYETKELGLDKDKFDKEELDHSVIITANEQNSMFAVTLAAMAEVLPDVRKKTEHVSHGFMQLVGGKMSSRKGNIVSGESLIENMREEAHEKMEGRDLTKDEKDDIADAVAIAAIKYSILKQGTGKDIVFDPVQSLSFEGDSGPYLQYSYVRAMSTLKKANVESVHPSSSNVPSQIPDLARLLLHFPDVLERAHQEYEPHHVTTYLTELAGEFNSWYASEKIVDAGDPESPFKVLLTNAFAITMKSGLWYLGIRAPEKM